ncbi:MAG: zeta toxin family protein [Gammaproteobacteria bacterium]
MDSTKRIIIIAGPNGAGKTTFANEFLPNEANCLHFINADLIAAGLSPFEPETVAVKAGKIMLQAMEEYIAKNESFVFETTLAAKNYARKIPVWQSKGYQVSLIFLRLRDVVMAIQRVSERVKQGGHNITEEVIIRRYKNGWSNFQNIYVPLVNDWVIYDNSSDQPVLVEWSE